MFFDDSQLYDLEDSVNRVSGQVESLIGAIERLLSGLERDEALAAELQAHIAFYRALLMHLREASVHNAEVAEHLKRLQETLSERASLSDLFEETTLPPIPSAPAAAAQRPKSATESPCPPPIIPPPVQDSAPPTSVRCRNCGSPVRKGLRFCTSCGAPLQQQESRSERLPMSAPPPPAAFSSAAPSKAPEQVTIRQVEFSAVAPKTLTKGDYSVLSVIMYEPSHRQIVENLIREMADEAQEKRSGVHSVADGAEIRVMLTSPDIELEDSEEIRVWNGGYQDFSFAVLLPEDYKKRQILFQAAVYIDGILATRLKFIVKTRSFLEQKLRINREDVLSAFLSYASEDRERVATILQGMKKARPDMDVFFDVENLRSGADWETALKQEIDSRDVLYLCWSRNAKKSPWVDREWRYAAAQKGAECIEPIPIEPPELCPPPEELNGKYFNDKLLYYASSAVFRPKETT